MTGFNLPPGCNVHDLPGNHPDDLKAEALSDFIYEHLPISLSETDQTKLADWIYVQIEKAYREGYHQGEYDTAIARDITGPYYWSGDK